MQPTTPWTPTARLGVADPPDRLPGTAPPLAAHEQSRVRAAAVHARRALPGPLGELAARELTAYADLGYIGAPDALVPRLARQVLALHAAVPPYGAATIGHGRHAPVAQAATA